MSTLSSLRTLTRQQYRFDPNGRVFGNDELDNYIKQSYEHVQNEMWLLLDEKESLAISSGTQEYALPTTLVTIADDGVLIDTFPLQQSTFEFTSGRTSQAKPTMYYLREKSTWPYIGFIDIPDASYTISIFYKGYRPTLSSSQDATTPTRFDLLIALYASYIAEYTLRGNTQNAINKLQAYNQEKLHTGKARFRGKTTFRTQR